MVHKKEIFLLTFITAVLTAIFVPYKLYSKQPTKKLYSSFIQIPSPANRLSKDQNSILAQKQQEDWITIFVHGSFSHMLRRPNIKMLFDVVKDRIEGTFYQKTTRELRGNNFFRKNQPIQGLGLKKVNLEVKPGNAPGAIANVYNELDTFLYQRDPSKNHYYTFGWEGLITKSTRYKASQILYGQLTQELEKFHSQGIKPKIRFIGYSHGANIVLNLANVKKEKKQSSKIVIDELIMLAMPIRNGIDKATSDPMFKKIYSFYSLSDRIQKADILGKGGSLFSRRRFINRKNFKLPEKLTQIRVKMKRNRTTKKAWLPKKDPRLNYNIPSILAGYSNLFRDASPLHSEWWFFSWTRRGYRKNFPLEPFSIASILPIMLESINNHGDNEKNLTIDLRPEQMVMMLKKRNKKRVTLMLLPKEKLTQLENQVQQFSIPIRTEEQYEQQIKKAIKQAKIELGKV
ncbi:hypothetical protein KAH94_05345 [bacterium]|nr:hypothetical protein [bacterium]